MQDEPTFKGEASEPSPDDLLSIPQIAQMYGIASASVRAWKLKPAETIPLGRRGVMRLYRRSDVVAYANSTRRRNRLLGQGLGSKI